MKGSQVEEELDIWGVASASYWLQGSSVLCQVYFVCESTLEESKVGGTSWKFQGVTASLVPSLVLHLR